MKVLHSICQYIWKTQQWPQDLKSSVFIPVPKKVNAKECSDYRTIVLVHTLAKWCSKFFKPGFNSTRTLNFQMFEVDLEKAEEPEIKLPIFVGSSKKQESSRKTSTSALLTLSKTDCEDHKQTVENSTRDGNTRPPDLPLEKSVCRSGSNS